jgi:hypothetical protein
LRDCEDKKRDFKKNEIGSFHIICGRAFLIDLDETVQICVNIELEKLDVHQIKVLRSAKAQSSLFSWVYVKTKQNTTLTYADAPACCISSQFPLKIQVEEKSLFGFNVRRFNNFQRQYGNKSIAR